MQWQKMKYLQLIMIANISSSFSCIRSVNNKLHLPGMKLVLLVGMGGPIFAA